MRKWSKKSLRKALLAAVALGLIFTAGCGETGAEGQEAAAEEQDKDAGTQDKAEGNQDSAGGAEGPGQQEGVSGGLAAEGQDKGSGNQDKAAAAYGTAGQQDGAEGPDKAAETGQVSAGASAVKSESAADAEVDFAALKAENPDIFAWLYVPGTDIDCPVLQSGIADDFYESHNACGEESPEGAVYIEMANMMDMTDFNTVLHGKAEGGGSFGELYRYADPDFFERNEKIYLYLEGNLLVYEIVAACEMEGESLIRKYNFTTAAGCNAFLKDLYAREIGKQVREGWEGLTSNHFLLTLTAEMEGAGGKQFIVSAALIEDAAGTINREILK
ncbi:MAG: class B sortase [Clostridium sp.]|nr:class B sortase [Clostridium sp.]